MKNRKQKKQVTDEEAERILRGLWRMADRYPIFLVGDDGRLRPMCSDCHEERPEYQLEAIQMIPRGQTVACGFCGRQMTEPPIMRLPN